MLPKWSLMNWRPLHWETAQNHFSTKAERMLLVTNATEYLVCHVFVCVYVCMYVCITVIWRANRERASRSHSGSPQKSHLLTMRYTYLYLCQKLKAVTYMTPSISRLSISASGAIFSSLVLVSVYYSPVLSPTLLLTYKHLQHSSA